MLWWGTQTGTAEREILGQEGREDHRAYRILSTVAALGRARGHWTPTMEIFGSWRGNFGTEPGKLGREVPDPCRDRPGARFSASHWTNPSKWPQRPAAACMHFNGAQSRLTGVGITDATGFFERESRQSNQNAGCSGRAVVIPCAGHPQDSGNRP